MSRYSKYEHDKIEYLKYRIKEPNQKVIIEKWLCRDYHGNFIVIETTGIDEYYYKKVKLIKSYEVEL